MRLVVVSVTLLATLYASQLSIPSLTQCQERQGKVQQGIVRQGLYNSLNFLRSGIANGTDMLPNASYTKEPKLMYGMKYDCSFENMASTFLEKGPSSHKGYAVLTYESGTAGDERLRTTQIQEVIDKWKSDTLALSVLLFPYVPRFGCAYIYEHRLLKLLCLFQKDDIGVPSQGNTSPCEKDADCDQYKGSICRNKLCWIGSSTVPRALQSVSVPPTQCPGPERNLQQGMARQGVSNYFNFLRLGIANGTDESPNANYKNGPKLMYGLRYDCILEDIAFTLLPHRSTWLFSYVVLFYESKTTGGEFLTSEEINPALEQWRRDPKAQSLLRFPFVTHFGCAHSYKNKLLQLLCVFRKDDEKVTDEHSVPCQQAYDCKEYKDSICYNKLCWLLD